MYARPHLQQQVREGSGKVPPGAAGAAQKAARERCRRRRGEEGEAAEPLGKGCRDVCGQAGRREEEVELECEGRAVGTAEGGEGDEGVELGVEARVLEVVARHEHEEALEREQRVDACHASAASRLHLG